MSRFLVGVRGLVLLLFVSASLVGGGGAAQALDREARLAEASEAYSTALSEPDRDTRLAGFARAQRLFASLVDDGVETAPLYVDLGNAALQAQDSGLAVLSYQRAFDSIPRIGPRVRTSSLRTSARLYASKTRRLPRLLRRPSLPRAWRVRRRDRVRAAALAVPLRSRTPGAWHRPGALGFAVWCYCSPIWAARRRGRSPSRRRTEARADSALRRARSGAFLEVDLLEERELGADPARERRDVWVRRTSLARVDPTAG